MSTTSILDELERIRLRNNGILLPEDIVKSAEPKDSPLHDRFNWDNKAAGHNWRLEQARHLIRVFVRVVPNCSANVESRMFVALSCDKTSGGGYRVLNDVLSDEALRQMLLKDALEDMRFFTHKYSTLVELADVFKAIDRATNIRDKRTLVAR